MGLMHALPPVTEMYDALVKRDPDFEGVFFVGVRTTGIFCRPTCPARKPKAENVDFYPSVRDALAAGFRPCLRCRPLEPEGEPPAWLRPLLAEVERDPARRWRDQDLREQGLEPARVRRWFQRAHGMSFHAYSRARRLGVAFGAMRQGADVTGTAAGSGWESESGFRDAFAKLFGEAPTRAKDVRTRVVTTRLITALGPMLVGATDEGVCLLEFCERRMLETQVKRLRHLLGAAFVPGENEHTHRAEEELAEYFRGDRTTFDWPLVMPGTPFQVAVWEALLKIPYGETRSYDQQARQLEKPGAQRAVGKANGDNRLAIVVPCHRVVRSDGSLSGYGGGLWRKRALLDLETGARIADGALPGACAVR
ncbi:MAG: bifunctional transcriptional activator/DNA repair protein Ada [bacterium]|nr:bifunctional transcriptional activator/DNA repair protein Ada [bacterium]